MKKLLIILLLLSACEGGSWGSADVTVNQQGEQDQSVDNSEETTCEFSESVNCTRGFVQLLCDDEIIGFREVTCDECPERDVCKGE